MSTAGGGHTALGPVRPTAAAAVAHRPLDYRPPGYRPPGYRPPGYGPPDHGPPGYGPPGYGPPGYGPPDHGPPDHGPPDHGPHHGPPDHAGVSLTGGMLHAWQQRNLEVSLPLALHQLETAGNLANLRLAISGATEGYRGPKFMDSDLYKTLEAVGWQLARTAAPDLADFAGEATALLEKAQQADGYLNSYVQVTGAPRYTRLASSHELYCAGHLIQAAVACHRGPGLTGLLDVARRFADHLVEEFMGTQAGLDGHPIVETALVELHRETGHEPYLRLASQFVEQRGHGLIGDSGFGRRYLQDHCPVRESVTEEGHVVRALYLEAGIADVAAETADSELLAASAARWDDMVAAKTYLTGGNGSRHSGESFGDRYELPPDRAYNETCAAIASFQWSWRLLLATGESKYADLMERVLYNALAAATSTDGRRFFYVNPLQRREDHFEEDDPGRRREWFSCACCPPNIMRLVASLEHYIATVAGDVLHVHQFPAAVIAAPLVAGRLDVEVESDYPWSGAITMRVRSAPPASCGLAVRIPGWSTGARVRLNGRAVFRDPADHGYLVLRRRWQPGDVLAIDLDVRPRLTYPARRIDAARGTVAVERGPLVYCFEQADQPAGTAVDDLIIVPGALLEREDTVPGVGHTVFIEACAVASRPAQPDGLPYMPVPNTSLPSDGAATGPITATAVPYLHWDNRDGGAMRVWMQGSSI